MLHQQTSEKETKKAKKKWKSTKHTHTHEHMTSVQTRKTEKGGNRRAYTATNLWWCQTSFVHCLPKVTVREKQRKKHSSVWRVRFDVDVDVDALATAKLELVLCIWQCLVLVFLATTHSQNTHTQTRRHSLSIHSLEENPIRNDNTKLNPNAKSMRNLIISHWIRIAMRNPINIDKIFRSKSEKVTFAFGRMFWTNC